MPTSKLEFDVSSKFPFYVRLLMETVVEKIQVAIHLYFFICLVYFAMQTKY